MPSDMYNWTMAKAMGLAYSLFDVASAREVPFAVMDLPVSSFVSHSSLLTAKVSIWW